MKPNILFILIDSFRSDKCFGPTKTSITPNLDLLIKNGTYFTQAISSAPTTIPTISSIFTALYPSSSLSLDDNLFKLNPKIITMIEILIENGYTAFATIPDALKHAGLEKIFGANIDEFDYQSNLYHDVGQLIIKRLDKITLKEPWFYYIHLYDIHGTATFNKGSVPNQYYDTKYGVNQYERMVSLVDHWIGKILNRIDPNKTMVILTADHGSDVGNYDSRMENIHKKVVALREFKKTPIFQTSHSIATKLPRSLLSIRKGLAKFYLDRKNNDINKKKDLLWKNIANDFQTPYEKRILENCITGMGHIYDDNLRVPLVFTGPNLHTNKIDQQIRTIDIFPTIIDILGFKINRENIHGQSLLPIIQGKEFEETPAIIESATNVLNSLNRNLIGIRTSEYKYFRDKNDKNKNIHLYNLKSDPTEENNIAFMNNDIVIKMEKILFDIITSVTLDMNKEQLSTEEKLSKEEKERALETLKKLGYI